MKPSSNRILGVLLIVLSVLALPLAFCQYLSMGFDEITCPRPLDIRADTRIAYCIRLSPWRFSFPYPPSELYAEGTTKQDEIQVRDLHFRREGHILWVNNQPIHPNDIYQAARLRATLNPWLILTSRFEIKNGDRTSVYANYGNAPANANVLYVSGKVDEGALPNPLGFIMLGTGIWLYMQGKITKPSIRSVEATQHSMHPGNPGTEQPGQGTPGLAWWESAHALRAVRQFAWLEVGSGKVALSRPARLSTGAAVSRHTSTPKGHNASR